LVLLSWKKKISCVRSIAYGHPYDWNGIFLISKGVNFMNIYCTFCCWCFFLSNWMFMLLAHIFSIQFPFSFFIFYNI
jgi:hypothetical protein